MKKKSPNLESMIQPGLNLLEETAWDFNRRSDLIELQFGENHESISEHVVMAIKDTCLSANKYPDLLPKLIHTISQVKHISEDTITVVRGTDEAFRLFSETFIEPEDECLIFPPTYSSIKPSIHLMQGVIVELNLTEDFKIPPISIIEQRISTKTKMIYIANPNTATGNLVADKEMILQLLDLPVIVVVDECYFELADYTVADLVSGHENLVITRTFTKTYGLAGLRIGYIVTNTRLTSIFRHISKSLEPFHPVGSMAGAIAALEDERHLNLNLDKLKEARHLLGKGLGELGIRVYPSKTTALLIDVEPIGIDGSTFVRSLLEFGVVTKTCEVYGATKPSWVYFGVPRLDDIEIVLCKVKESLATKLNCP